MFAKTTFQQSRLSLWITTGLVIFVLALLADQVAGQSETRSYDVDPIAEEYIAPDVPDEAGSTSEERAKIRALKKQKANVDRLLKASEKKAENGLQGKETLDQAAVQTFMDSYVFPKMTQTDNDTLANLGMQRAEFVSTYLSAKVTGANRNFIIETIILPKVETISQGNYHPAVRLNAVLLAGLINGVEPDRSTFPQVSGSALSFLLETMNSPESPEFLKVGAMTGLHRNALFDGLQPVSRMEAAQKSRIEQVAVDIIGNKVSGQEDWKPEVNYWLRRRAIQTLGYLKNPARTKDLIAIVGDSNEKTWVRLDATTALKGRQLAPADADSAVVAITTFTAEQMSSDATGVVDALSELVAINLLYGDVNLLGNVGGGRFNDGMGGRQLGNVAGVELANYQLNQIRRKAKAIGTTVNEVLEEISQPATGEKKTIAISAQRTLNEMMTNIDEGLVDLADQAQDNEFGGGDGGFIENSGGDEPTEAIADKLAATLRETAQVLNKLVGGKQAPGNPQKGDAPADQPTEPVDPDNLFG